MKPAAQPRRQPPDAAGATRVALGATERRPGAVEASSVDSGPLRQVLVLDGFPTPGQVRLLGPNNGHGNRYAISTCRQFVKGWTKLETTRQGIVPVSPPVLVTLRYVMPDARARDADNFAIVAKPVIDGLVKSGILAGDDSKRLTERVVFVKSPGARRLEIVLERLPGGYMLRDYVEALALAALEPAPAPGTEGE
jgi:hypothetical protein